MVKIKSLAMNINLINGDCLGVLKTLPENSIDSLVTDPPAGISFMNKSWDDDKGGRDEWIKWLSEVMKECHRVLKPGAHGLVWALPRTSHWTAMALEYAGFEVRDCITHLFGQGFPKSLNISIAIDKAAGAKREVIGEKIRFDGKPAGVIKEMNGGSFSNNSENVSKIVFETKASTDAAKQWDGWGTALKPAAEFWWLVRKPISEKTVAKNILKWGTGGLNIDGCRVEGKPPSVPQPDFNYSNGISSCGLEANKRNGTMSVAPGRFPANLVLSHSEYCTDDICDIECAIKQLDEQSIAGGMHSAGNKKESEIKASPSFGIGGLGKRNPDIYKDSGGASRFFYCAKISTKERNEGCEDLPKKQKYKKDASGNSHEIFASAGDEAWKKKHPCYPQQNNHPTVKPKKLMAYLCRLITPPNGTILDPFMGAGSTGIAAKLEGFNFIGIEKEKEYFEIADKRIKF